MNRDRLLYLRDVVLPRIKPENFDMRWWTSRDCDCDTVHCLGGWAALDPTFNSQGLTYTNDTGPSCDWEDSALRSRQSHGFAGLGLFFDIDLEETIYLFSSRWFYRPGGNTLEHARERITHILDGRRLYSLTAPITAQETSTL